MVEFSLPRGTMDFLPEEMAQRRHVEDVVRKTFESFGFQEVQTPIFEEFALLAARSGEEIREGMFTFVADEVEYALRPELTAAVCRMIVTGKMDMPKPYKVYYLGPCFRYEEPQAGRYRQFWQAGIELMGSSSPMADAEVITVGAKTLDNVGITPYRLKVGNIGIFRGILEDAGLDMEDQNRIIGNIDGIMSTREKCALIAEKKELEIDDQNYIRTYLSMLYDVQMSLISEGIEVSGEYEILPSALENLPPWIEKLPTVMEQTYRAAWIAEGVPEKTVDLLLEVSKVSGPRSDVMPTAQTLLKGSAVAQSLQELDEVLTYLEAFGVKNYEVVLGVARGLDYYTGTVFEFDVPLLGAQKQVCGGGRYDKLVEEFGGLPTPATGYAFGFDRIVLSRLLVKDIPIPRKVDVFIAVVDESLNQNAVKISQALREKGYKVEIEMTQRDLKGQLGYASEIRAKYCVILGPKELREGKVMLKNLETEAQTPVALEELAEAIEPDKK
ncbi:MAG: histidine--tRNA ligase [Candidatus Methanofastidiosia archaeon]